MLSLRRQLDLELLIRKTIADDAIYNIRSVAFGSGPEIKSIGFTMFGGSGFSLNVDKLTDSEIGFILLRTGCKMPLNLDPRLVDHFPVDDALIRQWREERADWIDTRLAQTLGLCATLSKLVEGADNFA